MEEYLSSLNQQQRDAVTYLDGPELVIAGAGSGKTRVLTHKIIHLLRAGYEPWRILALTFTNKAAREMRTRIEDLLGVEAASKLWMGTFHSIFARLLRQNAQRIGFKSSYTIYDSADSKSLVKMIIKDMGLDDKFYKPSAVLSSISAAKNALIGPDAYRMFPDLCQADKDSNRPLTADIYAAYAARCRVANAMDFDDLLFFTYALLRDNPDVLAHYQEFFRYILVDEYQDTNFAQHSIISLLSGNNGNLCVVGDDAQSIYSFRGANIRNILNLKNGYPNLEIFKLEQNYRSTQNILNAANSLIEKNSHQYRKNIFSKNAPGSLVEVVKAYSDYEESVIVANRISQLKMATGDSLEEFAILYRTNAQSRILEESLRKRNIAYRIWGGLSFYQRKEVKDAVAYFRLAVNPNDDEALRRVINTPARGIGETTLKKLGHTAISAGASLWSVINYPDRYPAGLSKATMNKVALFRDLVVAMQTVVGNQQNNAYDAAKFIIDSSRLIADLMSEHTPESISRRENLNELLNGIREFVEGRREQGIESMSLTDFLAEVSLATDQDTTDDTNEEKVTLMTVHAAKGLEFNNVIIVGVEDDLFPSAMSKDSFEGVEEERRLLYVALTRARRFCMMSYAASRYRNGQTVIAKPSPFLRDIDRRWLNLVAGTQFDDCGSWTSRAASSFHSPASAGHRRPRPSATRPVGHRAPEPGRPTVPASPSDSGGDFTTHSAAELSLGAVIEHSRFGLGKVVKIDVSQPDARIVVEFGSGEERTLMLRYARFKIL